MSPLPPVKSPSPPLEALIFDCDGTLVNSMSYFFIGWTALCKKHSLTFPESQFYALAGLPVPEIVKIVFDQSGRGRGFENLEETEAEFEKRIAAFMDEKHEFVKGMRERGDFPGEITAVTEIARANKALGEKVGLNGRVPMAVASSGDRKHVVADLKRWGLIEEFFSVKENLVNLKKSFSEMEEDFLVVTRECVEKGKPEPDLFLEACNRLGVNPENCRGFEDADLGIESLRRAGFKEENIVDVRKLKGYPN